MGNRVKLIPAQHVTPFVRGNKSDHNDALAIAEAAGRPGLRGVPVKTVDQQDIQCLHRLRERYLAQRTSLSNQTRGLLSEFGIVATQGHRSFCSLLHDYLDPACSALSERMKAQLRQIADEYAALNLRIKGLTDALSEIARNDPLCQLLLTIPGIGV